MVVTEINFARQEDSKRVLFREFDADKWGTLILFIKGSDPTNQMVCNWIKQWLGEADGIEDCIKKLEHLIIRVNNELLELNKVNGTNEYISLTLILLRNDQRWFASFGGNYVVGCKKSIKTNKFRKAIDFGTDLQSKLIGQQEIHRLDSLDEQDNLPGQKKHFVDQKTYKVDTEHERILLFASEYKKFIVNQEAKEILFIAQESDTEKIISNIKKSLRYYINNKNEKKQKYYTLHGYLIEPRHQLVLKTHQTVPSVS